MKFNPISFIAKLFDNKKFLMAFSFICAVIFWLVIDISENPVREVTISDIQITIGNQRDDNGTELKVVSEYEDNLSVTVSGPGYIVTTVKKEDIIVNVKPSTDVNKPGTYTLDISATVNVTDCSVVKLSQNYLTVVYDYDTSAEIPVEIDTSAFQEMLPQDCEIFKSFLKNDADGTELSTLSVSGPSGVIGAIKKVVVTPIIPEGTTPGSQSFEGTLVFKGNDDKTEIDASQLVYNTDTFVRVIVYKVADVPLKPTFTNLPLCYSSLEGGLPPFELKRYNGNARANEVLTHVKVRGPIEVMDELIKSGLSLSPIDFMKVQANNTSFNVSFVLENGVEIVDGTEEITVVLKLGSLKTTTVEIAPSNIKFKGLPSGLTATSSLTKPIKVTVCYDRNKNTATQAKNGVVLVVDCSGITTPSSVTKPITVTTSSGKVFAWANVITPAETVVEIK